MKFQRLEDFTIYLMLWKWSGSRTCKIYFINKIINNLFYLLHLGNMYDSIMVISLRTFSLVKAKLGGENASPYGLAFFSSCLHYILLFLDTRYKIC